LSVLVGRYWANITDTMISGSYTQWSEGDLGNRVYKAGKNINLYLNFCCMCLFN